MRLQVKALHVTFDTPCGRTREAHREARQAAPRPDARRGDVLAGAQPVDRRRPLGGGDRVHEGAEPRRARVGAHRTRRRSTCSWRSSSGRSSATATSGCTSRAGGAAQRKAAVPAAASEESGATNRRQARTKQPHDAHLMPVDPGRHWLEAGITGIPRQREWDAVVSRGGARAAGRRGGVRRAARTAASRGVGAETASIPAPLAAALEGAIEPPYRAVAVRREELWAVGAVSIEVVELSPRPRGR